MNITTTTNYASLINSQFGQTQSNYVSIEDRFLSSVKLDYQKIILSNAVLKFKEDNPHINSFNDLSLCRATTTTLDKIVIDTTLQRLVDFIHLHSILTNFWEIKVMPIQVYENPEYPGKFICWDGQHTAIALYIIAAIAYGEQLSDCNVPVVIYQSDKKTDMRKLFIDLNGDAKKPLDPIDIFQQKVFGVRTDNSADPDWLEAEQKQQYLEASDMFATNAKFSNTNMPGALSRMEELSNSKYQASITKHFAKYFNHICGSSRAVQPKESVWLYEYFRLCEKDTQINITDQYIESVADALAVVGNNDFDAIEFLNRAKKSYSTVYINSAGDLRGISYSKGMEMTFLIAQIAKAGVQVPLFFSTYNVPAHHLF